MRHLLNKIALGHKKSGAIRPSRRGRRRVQPQVEALEDRRVPSTVPWWEAPKYPITDMTALAQHQAQKPSGPTTLWLNFDGANGTGGTEAIGRFNPSNRNQLIHEVLFRTAEILAPFNVYVRVRNGFDNVDTSSNGNTTIFIGDHARYGASAWTWAGWIGVNGTGGHAPAMHSDFPSYSGRGVNHRLNSDPFNIAYVDPMWSQNGMTGNNNAAWISKAIAHEAGHTFGLGHVRTIGNDPAPLGGSGTIPEVMSYDSLTKRFSNHTLTITAFNNTRAGNRLQPLTQPWAYSRNGSLHTYYKMKTQNSYTYLKTVLGVRPKDDRSNLADPWSVDPYHFYNGDSYRQSVSRGGTYYGTINYGGDFDVFRFYSPSSASWKIRAERTSGVDPVLMVYDRTIIGSRMDLPLAGFDDDGAGSLSSELNFNGVAGRTYMIVVGSYKGNSIGSYRLTVDNAITGGGSWGTASAASLQGPSGGGSWGASSYSSFGASGFDSYGAAGSGADFAAVSTEISPFRRRAIGRAHAHRRDVAMRPSLSHHSVAMELVAQEESDYDFPDFVQHSTSRRWETLVDELFRNDDEISDV